jgi:ribokinase
MPGISDLIVVASFGVALTVRVPRMPFFGETLVGDLFDIGPGGKGTNLAIAATRQGIKVTAMAKIGNDYFGTIAYDVYKQEGLDTEFLLQDPANPTMVGLVYLQSNGENTISLYRGACLALSSADVDRLTPLIRTAKIVATQLEISDEAVEEAVKLGRQHGLRVLLNPAPARVLSNTILSCVDILTPNRGEAYVLVGLSPNDNTVGLIDVGEELLRRGPKAVIITLGADGCILFQRNCSPVEIPAYTVNVIDTVGAGDAFNGGLAVALLDGRPLADAARWANITAALSTTRLGAINGLPSKMDVDRCLDR